jgi:hypothetical protein
VSAHTQVDAVRKVFEDSNNNPPLTSNMPPVAGAIRCGRHAVACMPHAPAKRLVCGGSGWTEMPQFALQLGGKGSKAAEPCAPPLKRQKSTLWTVLSVCLGHHFESISLLLACRWARGLFGKIKRTMARLQSLEADLESMQTGQKAMAACRGTSDWLASFDRASIWPGLSA